MTILDLDYWIMAINAITVILGVMALVLAGFLLINERRNPWERKDTNW